MRKPSIFNRKNDSIKSKVYQSAVKDSYVNKLKEKSLMMTSHDYQPIANKLDFGDIEKYDPQEFKSNFTECMYQNLKKEQKLKINKKKDEDEDDALNKSEKSKRPIVRSMNSNVARILIVCQVCYIIIHTS